jgi:hypothetical protein
MLGRQQADGMSELRGVISPELRATLEAVFAKLAAPGMCNPVDEVACVDGAPSQEAIDRDTRSAAQRGHDALQAALRALLASGELGQRNGLPAGIIVTTTLRELEAAAGRALTGGGTILPMSDVIRLGRHAEAAGKPTRSHCVVPRRAGHFARSRVVYPVSRSRVRSPALCMVGAGGTRTHHPPPEPLRPP